MRFPAGLAVLTALLFHLASSATNHDLEATKFIQDASKRYFSLYDKIADETYQSIDDEDFEAVFAKFSTVKRIAAEVAEISTDAANFDLSKISDAETKNVLKRLRLAGSLFVLDDEYFSLVLINLAALQEIATDKDIEPYLGGALQPNQDDGPLAYYPDIQKVYERSSDADELKYYWETFRAKNSVWATVNFASIIEAFQKAAKKLDIDVLDLWYSSYNNTGLLQEMENVMTEIKPAYQQLHSFIRAKLFKKYGASVIDPNGPIPDHMFQQVLDQAWRAGSVIEDDFPHSELPPYDEFVKDFDAKKMIDESERFYTSLGFSPLGEEFYRDRLKEHDETENSGDCRADIYDFTPNVYMKYCKKVDFRKFMQNHGYMGRVHYAKEKKDLPSYYFESYGLEFPVGEAVILSASTPKHLGSIGLAKDFKFTDKVLTNRLFRMGIHTILNIPIYFVHIKIMNNLLNGSVELESVNKQYWKMMMEYAGVEPPSDREEGVIDFPYKFYVDIEENHSSMKFISEVLGYQIYRSFCKKAGITSDLQNCDFYGNMAVGNDLKSLMAVGSSKPWHEILKMILPENPKLSGEALLEYYAPIVDWLKTKNAENKSKIGWNDTKKKIL